MSDVQTGTGSHSENKFEEYYEGMLKMSALTTRFVTLYSHYTSTADRSAYFQSIAPQREGTSQCVVISRSPNTRASITSS